MAINPVGTWADPLFQSQTGTAYKTNLDNCIVVGKRLTNAFAPHAKPTPDMNVLVDAGGIFSDGVFTEKTQQTAGPFTAPTTNPRIDRVVVDAVSGNVSIVAGTEAGSPVAPNVPDEKIPVCQVSLTVGMVAITNAHITDERVGGSIGIISVKDRVTADVTVVNTSAETDLWRKTIAAGTLGSNKLLSLTGVVTEYDSDTADTCALRFKFGASTVVTITISMPGSTANATGVIKADLYADGATNAQLLVAEVHLRQAGSSNIYQNIVVASASVDSTAAQDFAVTADWSAASAANKIVLGHAHLRKE
jgi:hypothetical protein